MKKIIIILSAIVAAAAISGCQRHEIDNTRSKSNLVMQITPSATSVVLDEKHPDAVALTVTWTPAHDYGDDYIMTYEYSMDVTTSKSTPVKEYEDDGVFTRSYTHGELQHMLTDYFGVSTRKRCLLRFTVSCTYGGPRVVIPDMSSVIVSVKTYGARQFAADNVFIGGSAVGSGPIEVTPKSSGIYVYQGNLGAGNLNIPVEYEGEHNIIIPEEAASTPIDGKAQPATVADSTATAGWTIPAADNYRVTINFNTRTVTVIPTSEIFEVDRIFLAGSAAPKDSLEVVPTLEEPSVYAFYDDLKAGELYMTVEYEKATNFAIVPEEGHDIADGAAVAFSQAPVKQVPGNKYWTVPADGKYRIVINTTARTIAICSPATDLPNKTVSYNNTVDKINPYTQEVKDLLWMWGGFNAAEKDPDQAKAGFQAKYTLKQSLANPYVFVYYGDPLPRKSGNYNSKNQETGATSGPAWLTFLVSNIENNVYAYGSTASAKRNNYTGTVEPALGETSTIVGGQGDNRYAYFVIPVDCNYVEVNIDAMTVVFDKR
ncbi:MAG: SusE domain-containing protein [Bacteroidales bacterium]|nr:SusE domain-containing protein [Bacteroidales bacterium]